MGKICRPTTTSQILQNFTLKSHPENHLAKTAIVQKSFLVINFNCSSYIMPIAHWSWTKNRSFWMCQRIWKSSYNLWVHTKPTKKELKCFYEHFFRNSQIHFLNDEKHFESKVSWWEAWKVMKWLFYDQMTA